MGTRFFLILVFILFGNCVTNGQSNADLEARMVHLEKVIEQQQMTIHSLKERLSEQSRQVEELKQSGKRNAERCEKMLEELREGVNELEKKLKSEPKQEIDELRGEINKKLDHAAQERNGIVKHFERMIDSVKEKLARDYEVVEFHGIEFIKVPAGSFRMGTTDADRAALQELGKWSDLYVCETPARVVTISKPFFISRCEITQAQWSRWMDNNPAAFRGDDRPVESVDWSDVNAFMNKLKEQSGAVYRLPSEAEWEYCALAGGDGWFGMGQENEEITVENIEQYAWVITNSENQTQPVGQKKPNAIGLYDMQGNVWEWCLDWYDCETYSTLDGKDPVNHRRVTERVMRGSCWGLEPEYARVRFRSGNLPDFKSQYVGFRLVREVGE
ncbi:MAG: SUMF1/EgtB/PvdO family nonheme iron enzyme [bacterium]